MEDLETVPEDVQKFIISGHHGVSSNVNRSVRIFPIVSLVTPWDIYRIQVDQMSLISVELIGPLDLVAGRYKCTSAIVDHLSSFHPEVTTKTTE